MSAERLHRFWRGGIGATTTSPAPSMVAPPRSPAASPQRPDHQRPSPVHEPGDYGEGHDHEDPWAAAATAAATLVRPPTPAGSTTNARDRKFVDYKVDPAPSWGGHLPEKNYKEYIRNMKLWLVEAEARLPHNLIGKRIIDSIPLGSKLSALVAHLTVDEITAENGHKTIIGIIEDAHEYLRDLNPRSTTRSSRVDENVARP